MVFTLSTFTTIHTALSLVALASGIVAIVGLLRSQDLPGWAALFLVTAVATSATGFGFPVDRFLPSHGVGIVSLVVLLIAILARYVYRFAGAWRWLYAVCVVLAVYLDAFVAIVQAFMKVPGINALAPTQAEPPFLIAQTVALIVFVVLAVAAAIKFRPGPMAAAAA